MRSATWLSILMFLFGGVSLSGVNPQLHPTRVGWALGFLLMAAGLALFARLTATFAFAVLVAIFVGASGLCAALHHPEWSLPGQPLLTICVALYILFRLVLSHAELVSRSHPLPKTSGSDEDE